MPSLYRPDIVIESHFSEEIMNLGKSHKFMDSMMNARENTEIAMSGNVSQNYLITCQ